MYALLEEQMKISRRGRGDHKKSKIVARAKPVPPTQIKRIQIKIKKREEKHKKIEK